MATVAERSKELAERIVPQNIAAAERVEVAYLIEQALLAERRLAMEEAIVIVGKCTIDDQPVTTERKAGNGAIGFAVKQLRAAAEKEPR